MKRFLKRTFSKRKENKKKGVSFQAEPEVVNLPLHEKVDVEDIWYTQTDYRKIRGENQSLLKMMKFKSLRNRMEKQMLEDDCRGLESLERESKQRSKEFHRQSLAVVFCEQEIQVMESSYDEESIAKTYRKISADAMRLSRQLAIQDEQFVLECVRNVSKPTGVVDCKSISNHTASTAPLDDDSLSDSFSSCLESDSESSQELRGSLEWAATLKQATA